MIKTYSIIAIIYGGSGRECAQAVEKAIKDMHKEGKYPIVPYILAKEVLNSFSIINKVKELIERASASVIILTFDDVDNTRVRQNVLIEMGMALAFTGIERCFFLSEKEQLPEDFPSDLKGDINPNVFDKNNTCDIANRLKSTLIADLNLISNAGILNNSHYVYDFRHVLDDIPAHIFNENANSQMQHILDEWYNNICSFDYVYEKIMYIAERI